MTPLFALVCAGLSFWAGLYLVGWQFLTGIVWLGGCLAWSYWYAFGEVKPAKQRQPLLARLKGLLARLRAFFAKRLTPKDTTP